MQKRMNTEAILGKLAEIRRSIPHLRQAPRTETQSRLDARSVEEFEAAAVVDALETIADDLRATVDEAHSRLYEQSLDVYYAAEELSRDPEHPEVIPHVEAMRAAHQNSYGRPIPSKEETELRRRRKGFPANGGARRAIDGAAAEGS